MNQEAAERTMNGKSIGSFIIGLISIFGLIFIQEATLLSLAGLILGVMGLKEVKQSNQMSGKPAWAGIGLNFIGLIGFVVFLTY